MTGTKIKLSSKTVDGITYTASGASSSKSSDFKGELSVKACMRELDLYNLRDVTLTAKLTSDAAPKAELKYDRKDVAGGKVGVTLTGSEGLATAAVEFVQPKIGLAFDANLIKRTVDASAAVAIAPVGYRRFIVLGAKGLLDVNKGSVSSSRVAASLYDGVESELTVEIEGKGESATVSYSHLVRPFTSVAGSMRYKKGNSEAIGTLGISTKVDDAMTIKSRLDTTGSAGLSFIQSVRPNTKIIMSTQFDVVKFDAPKVGLSITLG